MRRIQVIYLAVDSNQMTWRAKKRTSIYKIVNNHSGRTKGAMFLFRFGDIAGVVPLLKLS